MDHALYVPNDVTEYDIKKILGIYNGEKSQVTNHKLNYEYKHELINHEIIINELTLIINGSYFTIDTPHNINNFIISEEYYYALMESKIHLNKEIILKGVKNNYLQYTFSLWNKDFFIFQTYDEIFDEEKHNYCRANFKNSDALSFKEFNNIMLAIRKEIKE